MNRIFLLAFTATFFQLSINQQVVKNAHNCQIKDGNEPNLEDEGCETYWQCKNYQGSLVSCEDEGHQFDFQKRVCLPNDQVWCQWQHQRVEEWREKEAQRTQAKTAKPKILRKRVRHIYYTSRADQQNSNNAYDYEDNSNYEYNANYDGKNLNSDYDNDYRDDSEYEYPQSPDMAPSGGVGHGGRDDDTQYDEDGKDYVCEMEYGHEPNLLDERCKSFWRCDEFIGSLIDCQEGFLYDYQAKACRHDSEVRCESQMHDFIPNQPKHVETTPRATTWVEKKDGGLTIVHHYYHGNAKPRFDSTGDYQEGASVSHVLVSGDELEDFHPAPPVGHGERTHDKR